MLVVQTRGALARRARSERRSGLAARSGGSWPHGLAAMARARLGLSHGSDEAGAELCWCHWLG